MAARCPRISIWPAARAWACAVIGALTKQINGRLEVQPEQVGKSFGVRDPI
jgi:hypothetical protein